MQGISINKIFLNISYSYIIYISVFTLATYSHDVIANISQIEKKKIIWGQNNVTKDW